MTEPATATVIEPATATTPRRPALASRCLAALAITPLLRSLIITHAVPTGQPWRTSCPHCAAPVGLRRARSLAPLLPGARCGTCRERLGPPPYSVEIVTLLIAAVPVAAGLPLGYAWLGYAWWVGCAIVLSFVDAAVHRLPDRLTYPAAGGFVLLVAPVAGFGDRLDDLLRAVFAGLGLAAGLAVIAFLSRTWLGFGDVKYALAIGVATGWLGWLPVSAAVFLACAGAALYGAGLGLARRATLRTHIPMGPFLTAGALLSIALFG